MLVYKTEFDTLRKLIGNKAFTFPDFLCRVEGDRLTSRGYCNQKTFIYQLEQILNNDVDEPLEMCFNSGEFNNIFQAFAGNVEINIEQQGDIFVISSTDGMKVMNIRPVDHTTPAPNLKLNDDKYDVIQLKASDLKELTSGFAIGAEEMTLTTKMGSIKTYFVNAAQSTLGLEKKVNAHEMKGQTVKFDKLLEEAVKILDPLESVEIKVSTTQPLVISQETDSFRLKMFLIPFEV